MAELADALDLGSSGRPWGFKSLYPHQIGLNRTFGFGWADFCLCKNKGLELRRKFAYKCPERANSGHPLCVGYGRTGESPFIRTKNSLDTFVSGLFFMEK